MRRILSMLFACVMVLGCLSMNAGAVEMPALETMTMRATGNFNMSITAYGQAKADTDFPMAAKETVHIKATYSPKNASLNFGLIDSSGEFHSINVKSGSIDETIIIPETGYYTFAIINNSAVEVSVSGTVRY